MLVVVVGMESVVGGGLSDTRLSVMMIMMMIMIFVAMTVIVF